MDPLRGIAAFPVFATFPGKQLTFFIKIAGGTHFKKKNWKKKTKSLKIKDLWPDGVINFEAKPNC